MKIELNEIRVFSEDMLPKDFRTFLRSRTIKAVLVTPSVYTLVDKIDRLRHSGKLVVMCDDMFELIHAIKILNNIDKFEIRTYTKVYPSTATKLINNKIDGVVVNSKISKESRRILESDNIVVIDNTTRNSGKPYIDICESIINRGDKIIDPIDMKDIIDNVHVQSTKYIPIDEIVFPDYGSIPASISFKDIYEPDENLPGTTVTYLNKLKLTETTESTLNSIMGVDIDSLPLLDSEQDLFDKLWLADQSSDRYLICEILESMSSYSNLSDEFIDGITKLLGLSTMTINTRLLPVIAKFSSHPLDVLDKYNGLTSETFKTILHYREKTSIEDIIKHILKFDTNYINRVDLTHIDKFHDEIYKYPHLTKSIFTKLVKDAKNYILSKDESRDGYSVSKARNFINWIPYQLQCGNFIRKNSRTLAHLNLDSKFMMNHRFLLDLDMYLWSTHTIHPSDFKVLVSDGLIDEYIMHSIEISGNMIKIRYANLERIFKKYNKIPAEHKIFDK